jgi:hypothetical protein
VFSAVKYEHTDKLIETCKRHIYKAFFGWENSTITAQNGSYETSSQVNFGMA